MQKKLVEALIIAVTLGAFGVFTYYLQQRKPVELKEAPIAKVGINAVLYDFDLYNDNAIEVEDNDVNVVAAPEQKIGYATTTVNIRSLPSTDSEIYGTLKQNDKIKYYLTNEDGQDWCIIELEEENLGYVRADYVSDTEVEPDPEPKIISYEYSGEKLTRSKGTVMGPSGKETYYNLDMSNVVRYMKNKGYNYDYWVRDDGVKMFGNYIIIACDLSIRPKGTIIPTSLGMGMVCDTGTFIYSNHTQVDIAVDW